MENGATETQVLEVIHVEGAVPPSNAETPTVTTPVVESETPIVETPTTTEQPTNYDWLKTHNINSENDLAAVFQREKDLQAKVQELENKPTYKTEFAKIADELSSKGVKPETIARFHGMKPSELDNKSAILTKMELDFPKLSQQEREAYFDEQYGELLNEDSILTEGAKVAKKVQLEKEATIARENLNQYVYEALNPNQVDPAILQKEEGRQSFWKTEGLTKLNAPNEVRFTGVIKLPENGGVVEKQNDFVYQVPAQDKQALLKEFSETVSNPMFGNYFDNSETGIKNANDTYEKMFWGKYGTQIAKAQAEHFKSVESKIHEGYAKLINNTSFRGVSTDVSSDKSVNADAGMANFLKRKG